MSGHHTMENTHPFRRALGRRTHLFAHNGTLTGIEQTMDEAAFRYLPIGEIVYECTVSRAAKRPEELIVPATV